MTKTDAQLLAEAMQTLQRLHSNAIGHRALPPLLRPPPVFLPVPQHLSARQLEICELIANGFTNTQIAAALFVSTETVKSHVRHALLRSGSRNRAHMVAKLTALKLINPPEDVLLPPD
jgi:DNA-binding NarL/FixJ family response regulator